MWATFVGHGPKSGRCPIPRRNAGWRRFDELGILDGVGARAFVFLMRFFGMPMIIESTHQGPTKNWANRIALAHGEVGGDVGVLSTAFLKARWAEDCDMCTEGTKVEIINRLGFVERALAAS